MVRKRYNPALSYTPSISRQQFGCFSILSRLKARIEVRAIAKEELKASGWQRSYV